MKLDRTKYHQLNILEFKLINILNSNAMKATSLQGETKLMHFYAKLCSLLMEKL